MSKILLRYRYDRVTNIRGIRLESLKYCHEFTTIYKNVTARTLGISYESVKNMPNASTNHVLLKLNSCLFLTIHVIFPQDRYEMPLLASACIRGIRDRFVADSWSSHEFTNELRLPTNAYESITIQLRCLRMHYEFVTK